MTNEIEEFHALIMAGSVDDLAKALQVPRDLQALNQRGETPLMTAVDAQSLEKIKLLLQHGADPEVMNNMNCTALGYAVTYDFLPAIEYLIRLGVDRGYRRKYPAKPFKFTMPEQMPMTDEMKSVMSEAEWEEMFEVGLESINSRDEPLPVSPLIREVNSQEALQLFLAAGDNLGDAPAELKARILKLPDSAEFTATKAEFHRDRTRRFGRANPEKMESRFWSDMVRRGVNAYAAREHYLGEQLFTSEPIWCNQRFGTTLTALPDGRYIQIGGEHEDSYDPDFCIYNDVIVFDGLGGFEIYAYTEKDFCPTDFHSATLVDPWIIVIGSLGYHGARKHGATPVMRLNTRSLVIEQVTTSGDNPGWIHGHLAEFVPEANAIRLSYGNIDEGQPNFRDNENTYWLDLNNWRWSRDAKGA